MHERWPGCNTEKATHSHEGIKELRASRSRQKMLYTQCSPAGGAGNLTRLADLWRICF